jgi:glycosylphosphatidylinositol phospholipase D
MNRVFPILLILLAITSTAFAAGVLTHGEVTQRAAHGFASDTYPDYETWLVDHRGALLAGADFPDWGWFFGFYDESAQAHNYGFVNPAVDYLKTNYPKPWTPETEAFAVFLLGVTSHIVADTSYDANFLETMAQVDYDGNWDTAHTVGDVGGDILCPYQLDLSYMEPWYVPTQDLATVYNNLGWSRVTPQILQTTMQIVFLATRVEALLGPSVHDIWVQFSPFQKEMLQNLFLGGLDEMGYETAWKWADTIARLEGPVKAAAGDTPSTPLKPESMLQWAALGQELINAGELLIHEEPTERGVKFYVEVTPQGIYLPLATQTAPITSSIERSVTFTSNDPYGYQGTSLAAGDFNGDGLADLAIGVPGYSLRGKPLLGAIRVVYSGNAVLGEETINLTDEPADVERFGDEPAARFGWAMAAVDLNADGSADLAVSAPTFGAQSDGYRGKVFVYFGTGNSTGLSATPDLTIEPDEDLTMLGASLASTDADGDGFDDLLIGSPYAPAGGLQRGSVSGFLSSSGHTGSLTLSAADWTVDGENDYDWFGAFVGGLFDIILVGAPEFDAGNNTSAGKLYVLGASGPTPAPIFTLTGTKRWQKLGSQALMFSPDGGATYLLAIGAPAEKIDGLPQAGAVYILEMSGPLLIGDLSLDDVNLKTVLEGTNSFAHFGSVLTSTDWNDDGSADLWVTAPYLTTDVGTESGGASLFDGPDFQAVGLDLEYTEAKSLFGNAVAPLDIDGDGLVDLAIGARRAADGGRNSGRVFVALSEETAIDDDDDDDDNDDTSDDDDDNDMSDDDDDDDDNNDTSDDDDDSPPSGFESSNNDDSSNGCGC